MTVRRSPASLPTARRNGKMTQDELDTEALDDTDALFDWGCVRLTADQVLQLRKAFDDFQQALAPYGELEQLTIDGVELS